MAAGSTVDAGGSRVAKDGTSSHSQTRYIRLIVPIQPRAWRAEAHPRVLEGK